jgi:HPt (histidine-containing phosphotransfer) domain-containing protein
MDRDESSLPEPSLSDLPILDPQPLRDLLNLGGSAELIHELIALFQEDVPIRLAILKTALDGSDAPQVVMEAHQLKGALGNLGLARFAELASRIEAQAREGRLEQAVGMAEAMVASYEEGLHALNTAYPQN